MVKLYFVEEIIIFSKEELLAQVLTMMINCEIERLNLVTFSFCEIPLMQACTIYRNHILSLPISESCFLSKHYKI